MFRRLSDGFSEVLRAWEGETAVVIGGGPSLTQEQCDYVRGKAKVIAVNNAYLICPWADILYFADDIHKWYGWNKDRPEFQSFAGVKVTIEPAAGVDPSIHKLRNADNINGAGGKGLSLMPTALMTGRNSGYQALNLAVLLGATRIILLGFDMKFKDGKSHCVLTHKNGHHPALNDESEFRDYAKNFSTMENPLKTIGVKVLNATPDSALGAFPKVSLAEVI